MSKHSQIAPGPDDREPRRTRMPSLVERAAASFDLNAHIRAPRTGGTMTPPPAAAPLPALDLAARASVAAPPRVAAQLVPRGRIGSVALDNLADGGFIVPGTAPTGLAEEMRIVKRQLLAGVGAVDNGRSVLVCSARPDEGKTFCAINLALSLAAEKDLEVVLIDADVAKPEILSTLGLESGPGLLDAIADPDVDVEACLIHTDVAHLAVLPAGGPTNDATELLASARTRTVLDRLRVNDPRRILIFDSPPALAASPAAVLAMQCGQAVFVVRAERTGEADLREALALLSACPRPQLLLNGVEYGSGSRRFGSYYGIEG